MSKSDKYDRAKESLGDLRSYLEKSGVTFRGQNFRCIIPGHEDKNPSAVISSNGFQWSCFACGPGVGGSVLDAYAVMNNMTVPDAVEQIVGDDCRPNGRTYLPKKVTPKPTPRPARLEGDELVYMQDCSDRLEGDAEALQRFADWRGWKVETLAKLAEERSLGLSPDGRLTFNYSTGVKYRNPDGHIQKVQWRNRSKASLWRTDAMYLTNPKSVIITEGETDAIRLVDENVEDDWQTDSIEELNNLRVNQFVIAIPSASYRIHPAEAELFRGITVIFYLDTDEAGQKALAENQAILSPFAQSLKVIQ